MSTIAHLQDAIAAVERAHEEQAKAAAMTPVIQEAQARRETAVTAMERAAKAREEAVSAAASYFEKLSAHVRLAIAAAKRSTLSARALLEARGVALKDADQRIAAANFTAASAREAAEKANEVAQHMARIRDSVIMATEMAGSSAVVRPDEIAGFAVQRLTESADAARKATEAAVTQAATLSTEAAATAQAAAEISNDVSTARSAKEASSVALALAEDAERAIVKASELLHDPTRVNG